MSWLIATLGTDRVVEELHALPRSDSAEARGDHLFDARIGDLHVTAGGSPRTCHFGWLTPERDGMWVVLGTGVGLRHPVSGASKRILDREDWAKAIVDPGSIQQNIEGQYVVLIASNDHIQCLVDLVGLRDLFVASTAETRLVSSRLDWLARVIPSPYINTIAFGGRWHLFYQLSYDAIIKGVKRLGPGGVARLTERTLQFARTEWQRDATEGSLEQVMTELALSPARSDLSIDLALSGGVDSRLLFGIYASSHLQGWKTHTFGSPASNDSMIANRISSLFKIPHKQYYQPFDLQVVERLLREFASQGMMLRPASTCLDLQYFAEAVSDNTCVVDGSFGELARRQMLKRMSLLGRKPLASKDYSQLLKHLHRSRADIFDEEFSKQLSEGTLAQLDDLRVSMPDATKIGIGNWLDLLVMKHGIPNVIAAEQARIDHMGVTFSPFVQSSFFSAVLATPVSERRNARLIKLLIKRLNPQLSRLPLAGPHGTYPFRMSPLQSYVLQSVRTRLSPPAVHSTRDQFLHAAKDLVFDTLDSRSVRECALYAPSKVSAVLEGYYNGNSALGGQLDWLLAFEFWRRASKVEG